MKWNEGVKNRLLKNANTEWKNAFGEEAKYISVSLDDLRAAMAHIEELEVLEQFTTPDYCLALSNADHEINALKKRIEELEKEPTLYRCAFRC